VSVSIAEYAKFFILGAVNREGSYEAKGNLALIDALALAGGTKKEADLSKIKVVRRQGSGSREFIVDLEIEAGAFTIQPLDSIIVQEYGKVFILGEVKQPGSYYFKKNLTVVEIVAMAGGFTDIANKNGVQVIRKEDGKKKIYRVPVGSILKNSDKSKDILLRENDTVLVPESTF